MAVPFDLGNKAFAVPFVVAGTPSGDEQAWLPGFNGRILGGWASYDTVPSSAGTCTIGIEIGTTDACTWTVVYGSTANYFYGAATLSTTDTSTYFDTDDVLTLDVTSANKTETTLNLWLLVQGR